MQRAQGPKPGPLAGRKRKPEEEISTHTKRERERLERMADVQRQVYNAKNADKQAVWRAINKVKNKETFKDASAEEKARLVAATRAKVMRKRKKDGRAAECVAERLGYRDDSSDDSSDVEEDEGNRAGNDVEELSPVIKEEENGTGDDVEETARVVDEHGNSAGNDVEETDPDEEQHLRRDHIETLSSAAIFDKLGEEHTRGYSKFKPQGKQLKNDFIWRYWATFWKDAIRDFACKVDRLAKMSSEALLAQQPHTYFSETDRACFRSLQSWPKVCGVPWAELTGPASWWGEDYDFAGYGWEAEVNDPRAMSARRDALDMAFAAEMPTNFSEYLFNFTELKVLRALPASLVALMMSGIFLSMYSK